MLETDIDSAFLLVCHDDVALAPDAVRILVTEALRSNAGVAGPKLVPWDEPGRLQHVGWRVDQFAVADDLIDPGERDQEQYDAVTDVFAVPSACVLVRAGLFASIGGFDPGITRRGEDVDLCWRAQLAGARVLVVPDAAVRHREDLIGRTGVDDIRRTRARHQIRTVLVTGSRVRLLGTVPLLVLLSLAEMAVALVTGRLGQVRDVAAAWSWNLSRLDEIRRRRRGLRPHIVTRSPMFERRRKPVGSANAFVRGQIGPADEPGATATAMRTIPPDFPQSRGVLSPFLCCSVAFDQRRVPAVGDFAVFPDPQANSPRVGGRVGGPGFGSVGSTPSGFGFLGVLAWLLGGSSLVRTLWVLGPVLVGLVGAWRLLAVTGVGGRRLQPWWRIPCRCRGRRRPASWTTLGCMR